MKKKLILLIETIILFALLEFLVLISKYNIQYNVYKQ